MGSLPRNHLHLAKMAKQLQVEKLRSRVQELQDEVTTEFTTHLSSIMEQHVTAVREASEPQLANGHANGKKRTHGKQFFARESVLTELFEISHIRTIYHIFVAMLALLLLHAVLCDIAETGTVRLNLQLVAYAFGNVRETAETWLLMFASVLFLVYPLFNFWATHRKSWPVLFDVLFSAMYVGYCGVLLYLPAQVVLRHRLPPASSFIVLLEQVRLFMKVYAFVRSNLDRALSEDTPADERCPNFSKFIFFLFVPTLVYRDAYPRTPGQVRWGLVVIHLGQVLGATLYSSFLLERFFLPPLQKYGQQPLTLRHLVAHVFGSVMPGMLCYLSAFFALLHAWMNAFAEMTRFADRLFYQDWWNVTNYASFFRTWNIVVHDWLYEYIYMDVVRSQGKLMATLCVFITSSIVHEYVLMLVFSFFFPMLFIQFGVFGVLLHFVNTRSPAGNVLLWMTLSLGVGLDMSFYTAEYYARQNCPQLYENIYLDFFSSRAWQCWPGNITDVAGGASIELQQVALPGVA